MINRVWLRSESKLIYSGYIMYFILILLILVAILTILKCKTSEETGSSCSRFGVMTDMHYYPAGMVNRDSKGYKNYLKQDAKLTEESGAVIDEAIRQMLEEKIEFVILAGDLSNEGEKRSHEELAEKLKKFTSAGIQVFVTPGNHDINNHLAVSYLEDKPQKIETIQAEDFENIYQEFGFQQAYSRDKETLSYCARIKEGLNIITLDANQYKKNQESPIPDGELTEDSLQWAEYEIKKSLSNKERIIGVMHHGLLEHFKDQGKTFSPFLVKDFEQTGRRLVKAGLDFVFTGHLHAQDISKKEYDGRYIFDIETAALTSVPFAWRLCCIDDQELQVETHYIDEIDHDYPLELSFRDWATERVSKALVELESYFLQKHNGLSKEQIRLAAPYYARAFMAHFCGDEEPDPADREFYLKHMNDPESPFQKIAQIFSALWSDYPASDNDITIKLRSFK